MPNYQNDSGIGKFEKQLAVSNILPVSANSDDPIDPVLMTTLHFEFYGTKPDGCTLFPFGVGLHNVWVMWLIKFLMMK